MSAASLVKYLYFAHASRPRAERSLFRLIRRHSVSSIIELGIGSGRRAVRMIQVAQRYTRLGGVSYTGIDLFEARPAGVEGPTLKQVHKLLSQTGARVRLVPGDPLSALSRTANELTGTDLVVVGLDQDLDSVGRAWFYVPRLLHPGSKMVVEQAGADPKADHRYDPVSLDRIKELAKQHAPRRAA
ncbi:MAG: hypothetical protein K8T25_23415 [Planctomycetia bacterium]|nr:hypothetical protein [Planctomycetia bacterium]